MSLVSQIDRDRAREFSRSLVIHNLHRIWDAASEAMNLENQDPDKLVNAIAKVAALTSKAQQAAHNYKGYFLAWKENEAETKAAAVGSIDDIPI